MTSQGEMLSAYLDGELPDAEAREIEARIEREPELMAELEALMAADASAKAAFDDMAQDPVPLHLAGAIRAAPEPSRAGSARTGFPVWGALAASLVMLAVGGAGGYFAGVSAPGDTVASAGWLDDIADYHAVYSAQSRHLVEVPASEREHIQAWLSKTVGAGFTIPDLDDQDLTFEGGRLLVAAGAPVAQLIYTTADGDVLGLCLKASDKPDAGFSNTSIDGFDMVSWRTDGADFVVVAPGQFDGLQAVAEASAERI